jgi:hypothetical protein
MFETRQHKNMIARNSTSTKLKTFTCKDAKLRQLLLWHQHHKGELGLCIPKHYRSRLRVRVTDVTKLRYTEKNKLVHVLEAAVSTFRKQKEAGNARSKYKQQSITNYFFTKEVHAKPRK